LQINIDIPAGSLDSELTLEITVEDEAVTSIVAGEGTDLQSSHLGMADADLKSDLYVLEMMESLAQKAVDVEHSQASDHHSAGKLGTGADEVPASAWSTKSQNTFSLPDMEIYPFFRSEVASQSDNEGDKPTMGSDAVLKSDPFEQRPLGLLDDTNAFVLGVCMQGRCVGGRVYEGRCIGGHVHGGRCVGGCVDARVCV